MCVSVSLSRLRSRELDVVVLRFLHRREELRLASCTNCFSRRYDAPLGRKKLWKFFRHYALRRPYTPVKTSGYDPAYEILEGSVLRDTLFTCQNLPIRKQASRVKTYPFVNGFRLVLNNDTDINPKCSLSKFNEWLRSTCDIVDVNINNEGPRTPIVSHSHEHIEFFN